MEIFNLTLKQMLMMYSLISVGFLLRKKSKLPENSGTVMAKLEIFIFGPALSLFTQMTECTVETFMENANLIMSIPPILTDLHQLKSSGFLWPIE